MKIGVMQGRLSPRLDNGKYQYFPTNTWKREFEIAETLGFDYIELVHDSQFHNLNRHELKEVVESTGVKASHLCYDSFDLKSAIYDSEVNSVVSDLNNLFYMCKNWGIKYITIPVIENNTLNYNSQFDGFIQFLNKISWTAAKARVEICMELDLNKNLLDTLFNKIEREVYPSINIGMTLDTGNHYFDKLGPKDLRNVKHVHIKDRSVDGQSCILGSGQTNFKELIKALPNKDDLTYTLQCSRADTFDSEFAEITNITNQLKLMKEIIGAKS